MHSGCVVADHGRVVRQLDGTVRVVGLDAVERAWW
jgi:hypothetical protein